MSKILKSFGMAALLVALLAGTGMAVDSAGVSVDGCVLAELAITAGPTTDIDLGVMSTAAPAVSEKAEDITIVATVNWKLTVEDTEAVTKEAHVSGSTGKMYKGTIGTDAVYLTNELTVNTIDVGSAAAPTNPVATGNAVTTCDGSEKEDLDYSQTIAGGDATGDYSIAIKYVLAASGT